MNVFLHNNHFPVCLKLNMDVSFDFFYKDRYFSYMKTNEQIWCIGQWILTFNIRHGPNYT